MQTSIQGQFVYLQHLQTRIANEYIKVHSCSYLSRDSAVYAVDAVVVAAAAVVVFVDASSVGPKEQRHWHQNEPR